MGLALGDIQDGLGEHAIGPREPAPRIRGDGLDVYTFVHEAQFRRTEHQPKALGNLCIVAACLGLHEQAHGPRIGETDMGA